MKYTITTLAAASLLSSTTLAQKVVKMNLAARTPQDGMAEAVNLKKRAGTDEAVLTNQQNLYSVNVTIGTPPQSFWLQVDTGSTDIWVNQRNSASCQKNITCIGGTYDSSASSTYKLALQNGFSTSYGDGTGASGNYFTDVITIGGVSVTNQTMGLATMSSIEYGLLGVGPPGLEASCSGGLVQDAYCYPNIMDTMVSEGKINSHAFSLYLDDYNATTGSILFGGVDTSKYQGPLVALPLAPFSEENVNINFYYTVAWTNLTITTPVGVENFWDPSYTGPALLDSGTSLSVFPDALVDALYTQFGAKTNVPGTQGLAIAPCYLRTSNATLDFGLGGAGGAVLRVPVREFLIDTESTLGRIWHDLGGSEYCAVGMQKSGGEQPLILGDVVMRAGYFVYDLDNREIAVAQANYNGGAENIQEIAAGSTSAIPGVSSTATGVTSFGPITGTASMGIGPMTYSAGGVAQTSSLSGSSNIPLASFTTAKYTGQGAYNTAGSSASASGSKGAASAMTVPRLSFEGLLSLGVVGLMMVAGGGILLL